MAARGRSNLRLWDLAPIFYAVMGAQTSINVKFNAIKARSKAAR
jgi:hypothetical protein